MPPRTSDTTPAENTTTNTGDDAPDTPTAPGDTPVQRDTPSTTTSTQDGEDFDDAEVRARYLEKGDRADLLALLDHYTGRTA